ncbi:MAG: hypothetical protein AB7U05_08975 [Mangrovibacterium sp.]
MNFTPKTKKMAILGIVAVVAILIGLYLYGRKMEPTDTGEQADDGTGSAAATGTTTATASGYSRPGTPLTQIGKPTEAAELQQRYAGMGREAIIADYVKYRFDADSSYLSFLQNKATEAGKSLATVKYENAEYLLKMFNVPGV